MCLGIGDSPRIDILMENLRASAYPHPVEAYPSYRHFIPVLQDIDASINKIPVETKTTELISINTVKFYGEYMIKSIREYIEKYKDTDESKTAAYDDVVFANQLIERMLDGQSIHDLINT